MTPTVQVELLDWAAAQSRAAPIRIDVFVKEQGVPLAMEWDEFDALAVHGLALAPDGRALATGRLLPDGHIGRLAVREQWRRQGIGRTLLLALVAQAQRRGQSQVLLHAQCQAVAFYEQLGFIATGPVFEEAGIPHVLMARRLP